jgi:capsular polysaccharide biosynthesis protein
MTLRNALRVLLVRWYITIPGILLSLALAAVTFVLAPPQYSSSGVAVLVQPKQSGKDPTTNPFLDFDSSLSTTALIIVQALDTPEAAAQIGLSPGGDSYTVKDVGTIDVGDQVVQPFIYIKSQASTAQASADIVNQVVEMGRQDLLDRQKSMRVLPQNYIKLDNVVDTTPPKPVLVVALAATGAVLLLGLIATFGLALLAQRAAASRRARREAAAAADAATAAAVAVAVEQETPDAAVRGIEEKTPQKAEEQVTQKAKTPAPRSKPTATRSPRRKSDSTVLAGESFPSAKAPLAKSGSNGSARP